MCLVLKEEKTSARRPVAFVVVRDGPQDSYVKSPVARQAVALMEELRRAGFPVLYHPTGGGASKQLQKALGAAVMPFAAVFLGENECAQQSVQLKLLDSQTQAACSWGELIERLRAAEAVAAASK